MSTRDNILPSCMAGSAPIFNAPPKQPTTAAEGLKLAPKVETDPRKIEVRLKQIQFGKNTIGYDNYLAAVPKHKRRSREEHPRTPDPYEVQSKRGFDGRIKVWRRALHKWDNGGDAPGSLLLDDDDISGGDNRRSGGEAERNSNNKRDGGGRDTNRENHRSRKDQSRSRSRDRDAKRRRSNSRDRNPGRRDTDYSRDSKDKDRHNRQADRQSNSGGNTKSPTTTAATGSRLFEQDATKLTLRAYDFDERVIMESALEDGVEFKAVSATKGPAPPVSFFQEQQQLEEEETNYEGDDGDDDEDVL